MLEDNRVEGLHLIFKITIFPPMLLDLIELLDAATTFIVSKLKLLTKWDINIFIHIIYCGLCIV